MTEENTAYFGAKGQSGVYQRIIALMPPHKTYIESHFGSGVVMKRKPASEISIGIDPNKEILDQFKGDKNIELHNGKFIPYMQSKDLKELGNILIYSDPPYLLSTRKSKERYQYEYTENEHIEFLRYLKGLSSKRIKNIISGYPSELYDDELDGWNSIKYQTMTRGGIVTECLWFDYEPDAIHWVKWAGENATDRQRIKRKVDRWQEKYKQLPDYEQIAILAGILEVEINLKKKLVPSS